MIKNCIKLNNVFIFYGIYNIGIFWKKYLSQICILHENKLEN